MRPGPTFVLTTVDAWNGVSTVAQEDEGGGVGELILLTLLIVVVASVVAFLVALLPFLFALRHGWRWTIVVLA